jgi:hypothetical protein
MINNSSNLTIRVGIKTWLQHATSFKFNALNICAERNTDVLQYRTLDTVPAVHISEGEIQDNQNILVNFKA